MSGDRITRRGLLAAAGAAFAGGLAGCETPSGNRLGGQNDPVRSPGAIDGITTGSGDRNAYTKVYAATVESVVLIRAISATGQGQGSGFVFRNPAGTGRRHYLVPAGFRKTNPEP